MGFSNQERINLNSKVLAAGVKDANEVGQWYETFFPNRFILLGESVWTNPDLQIVLNNPAKNVATAQSVAASNPTIIQDLSTAVSAIRLTEVTGSNGSTYVAFSTYGDLTSDQLKNWIQPQLIPRTDAGFEGFPSIGYAVRLFEGDPNAGGTEIFTSAGQTGSGELATVGWIFDYANGMLLISEDFRASITNPYILGFRYIGSTAENSGDIKQVQETISVIDNQTAITLSQSPQDSTAVQMFVNGIKQQYSIDYSVSGTSVTYSGIPDLSASDKVEFWYLVRGNLSTTGAGTLAETLSLGNTTDGYDIDLNSGSALVSTDGDVTVNDNLQVNGDGYFTGDLGVAGKLTVDGLIDPTGLVLDAQSSTPFSAVPGKGTIWLNSDGYLVFSDQNDIETVFETVVPNQSVYWVDGYNGSDSNIGNSEVNALLTLDEALKRAEYAVVDVIINVKKSPDPNGYTSERLFKPRIRKNDRLTIQGASWEDVDAGPYTITGFDFGQSVPFAYTFGNQGWTDDEFVGSYLLLLTSSGDFPFTDPEYKVTTIVANNNEKIWVSEPFTYRAAAGTQFGTSGTVKIVKPDVKIGFNPSSIENPYNGGAVTIFSSTTPSAESNSIFNFETNEVNGLMRLLRLELALNPSNTEPESKIRLSGCFELGGVVISKSTTNSLVLECNGSMLFGGLDDQSNWLWYGAGPVLIDRDNALQPRLEIADSLLTGSWVGGQVRVMRSQVGVFSSFRIDASDYQTIPDPSPASLYIGHQSLFRVGGVNNDGLWIKINDSSVNVLELTDHSTFWQYSKMNIDMPVGSSFGVAEYHAHLHLGWSEPTFTGGGVANISLNYHSSFRLLHMDGSSFGDLTLGTGNANSQIIRPAGAWEVGEYIINDVQQCSAYRT